VEQLYLLLESRCSTCSNIVALRAPGKQLLHYAPVELLYVLPERVLCYCALSRAAACAPLELLSVLWESRMEELLRVFQWNCCLCSQKAAAP